MSATDPPATTLTLTAPASGKAGLQVRFTAVLTDAGSAPVAGAAVALQRLGTSWTTVGSGTTDGNGQVVVNGTLPPGATKWRASYGGDGAHGASGGTWQLAGTSGDVRVDNVPPTAAVVYPAGAPRPVGTAAQARAQGVGANAVVTAISKVVWRSMVRRSWHRGCPVGRAGLRLLRINHWGFDGYRYRGEMVLSSAVATRAAGALRDMYNRRFPIRRMYRVDRFGWSKKLGGANDYASMRADNTSAFNCRRLVNSPGVRSPHTRGRAVDINTWENPYRSRTGLVPNSWWASHSHPRVAWRSSSHPVVQIWRAYGFRWTYGNVDSQHVDGRTARLSGSFTG